MKGKKKKRDLPGGPVVKNPPFNAGEMGSFPGCGTRVPYTMEQLSLSSTTTEPMGSTTRESVCLNEDPHGAIKTQCSQMSELLTNKKDTYGNPGE